MLRNATSRGLARWGKTFNLHPLTSSYSSLHGADISSVCSVIQGLHRGLTFAGFLYTNPSQVSSLLLPGVGECSLEKSGHARCVVVWVGLQRCDVASVRDVPERRVRAHPLAVDLVIGQLARFVGGNKQDRHPDLADDAGEGRWLSDAGEDLGGPHAKPVASQPRARQAP